MIHDSVVISRKDLYILFTEGFHTTHPPYSSMLVYLIIIGTHPLSCNNKLWTSLPGEGAKGGLACALACSLCVDPMNRGGSNSTGVGALISGRGVDVDERWEGRNLTLLSESRSVLLAAFRCLYIWYRIRIHVGVSYSVCSTISYHTRRIDDNRCYLYDTLMIHAR